MAEGKEHALAIGLTTLSTEEMYVFSFLILKYVFCGLFF